MDGPKIMEVIGVYRSYFKEKGVGVLILPKDSISSDEMTVIIEVLRGYFKEKGVGIADFPHNNKPSSKEEILAHCHGRLDKMAGFVKEARREKNLRWLGFILGCLWSRGEYSRSEYEILVYCHGLLDKMENLIKEEHIDEAFVRLGFVQGCLWSTGQYSLEDLKNHNRPAEEAH